MPSSDEARSPQRGARHTLQLELASDPKAVNHSHPMGLDRMNGHDHDIQSRLREPLWFDEIMRREQGPGTDPAEMIYGCGGCFILVLIALLPFFLIGMCAGG